MKRLVTSLFLFIGCLTGSLSAAPGQVIIIPQAEVDSDGNLTQHGLERAGALAAYIGFEPSLLDFGTPVAIFAARPTPTTPPYGATDNTRSAIDTALPTGNFLKLPIHSGYSFTQETALANFILNNPNYNGKNVLICWRNEGIDALTTAFGVTSATSFPNVANETRIITLDPTPTSIDSPQVLLFGD